MPSTSGGEIAPPGNTQRVKAGSIMSFGQMFNVQRLLGRDKIIALADRMAPGGSGNPFEGLSTHEREELASLYRQGFARGNEFMISEPMGQMWLWTSLAEELYRDDRGLSSTTTRRSRTWCSMACRSTRSTRYRGCPH
jgi:hypothetical protein